MRKKIENFLLKFWPVIIIFLVWFIFSSPYFLSNRVPFSSTYQVNFFAPWTAYPGFASPVKNNAMPDVISQIIPWKNYTIETFKNLNIPLWNPYSFSGTTHLANYQSAVLSPFNLIFFILPFIDAWSLLVLLQPLFAGIFMYMLLRSLRISKISSVVGSLGFMFCGFMTTWMGYATLGYAIIFLPLSIYAIEKYYQSNKTKFLILFSLTLPLSFFSGHFQTSLYFSLFVLGYLIYKFFQTKNLSVTLSLLFFTFIGILFSLPQLLPSIEAYLQSLRSGIFQKIEVIPWSYIPTFIAPDFFGNPVTRNDWFGHYAEWNAYIGLLPIMLSVYLIFSKKIKSAGFFVLAAIISILLSFQTPFLDLLVQLKIPVLSTSAASRIIVIFSFSMSILAAFGLEQLLSDLKNSKKSTLIACISFFAVVFITLWIIIFFKLALPMDKIIIARQNLILPTFIFLTSVFVISVALFLRGKKYSYILNLISLILILVVAFDLLRFANKWMPFDSRNLMYPTIPIQKEFEKISGYNRILSNLGGEATTYYKLPSVEGYDAVYIRRYGEFIASLSDGSIKESARSVVSFPKNGLYTPDAINLLNVKYIVHKVADGRAPWAFPFWNYKDGTFRLLYNDEKYQILENTKVFPRAYLVNDFVVEKNPQKILNTMFSKNFDLRKSIVLEEKPDLTINKTSGTAKIVNYGSNKVVVQTNSSGNSLLFLSDIYSKGWNVYIDGIRTNIYRANYTFRAVAVAGGKHEVVFVYEPLSFKLGLAGASFGLLFMLGFVIKRRFI